MITSPEYGVASPWGCSAVENFEAAQTIVKNMKQAGHKAKVMERQVSRWQEYKPETSQIPGQLELLIPLI